MGKTMGSTLLQLAIFVLLLNYIHAVQYFTIHVYTSYDKDHLFGNIQEDVFDIFRDAYNFFNNNKYLREVTCKDLLLKLASCPFKEQADQHEV
uniref:Cystatin domain-containing protein n=1 Tax=Mus spicilegus TaxID=10103 RepID=A0A8C6HL79_MUSSI